MLVDRRTATGRGLCHSCRGFAAADAGTYPLERHVCQVLPSVECSARLVDTRSRPVATDIPAYQ